MPRSICVWHGIHIDVEHGEAPKNRQLYRFTIKKVMPENAHLPLQTPQHGFHYVSKDELGKHADFWSYLIDRLERDAPKGLLSRNARVLRQSQQLSLDLSRSGGSGDRKKKRSEGSRQNGRDSSGRYPSSS